MPNNVPKKAMVFAAGLGTRMHPITKEIPKPLVKVNNKTLLDFALDKLAEAGVQEVVVNTHYKAEMVEEHLKTRTNPKVKISREEVLLETGGGIAKVLDFFGNEPFYVINSDVMWTEEKTSALNKLANKWDSKKMDALLLLHNKAESIGYDGSGDFNLNNDGRLKREISGNEHKYVFMGVQILHPRIFRDYPNEPFSLNFFYKRTVNKEGILERVYGIEHDGGWLHIGTPQGIKDAEEYLKSHPRNS